jgi:DNA-binding NtrC family response regulator
MAATTRVLLVEADPALAELLEEWLAGAGCAPVEDRPERVLVDLPFLRERREELLRQLADAHPGIPIVAMPKPLTRDALVAALRRTLDEVQ